MENFNINELRFTLRKLERELDSQLKSSTDCCGVSFVQCHTLLEIERQNVTSLKDLALSLELDSSTVSRTIDSLVKEGLVIRAVDHDNRRYIRVALSSDGEKRCKEINKLCNSYYESLFNYIPGDKREQVAESLHLFVKALDLSKKNSKSACASENCGK